MPSTATSANDPSMARTAAGSPLEHAAARLVQVDVVQLVQARVEQVDDAFDGALHPGIVRHVSSAEALRLAGDA